MTLKSSEYREQLKCNFKQIEDCFEDYIQDALRNLSPEGIDDYLSGASKICMIGRGWEPVSTYLEEMPEMAQRLDESILTIVSDAVWSMSRTPNGNSIPAFMQCLPEASRRLGSLELMDNFFSIVFDMMESTTGSIHGIHQTIPSPGLTTLLNQMPYLLNQLSLEGLKNWVDYGVRNYNNHPERQKDFFGLISSDSKAMLQRERHGTLFMDNERSLDLYLLGLWQDKSWFAPYSIGFDKTLDHTPYYDSSGIRIPDVYDDYLGVSGINRYRITIAHMAAHRRWSNAIIADNFSPFQRLAIEFLEDSRIEYLMLKQYPGLRKYLLALHPEPIEDDCDSETESCIRHRLAMLSRAILDPKHNYKDKVIIEFVQRFYDIVESGDSTTKSMVDIAITFTARTRLQSDQAAQIRFENTIVDYRDDNRHLWIYIEENDEAEDYDEQQKSQVEELDNEGLPPRHYPEWDYNTSTYKPDWVSLYESIHPTGKAKDIDDILEQHRDLAKRLNHILDLLKQQ